MKEISSPGNTQLMQIIGGEHGFMSLYELDYMVLVHMFSTHQCSLWAKSAYTKENGRLL